LVITNSPPSVSTVDYVNLQLPKVGDTAMHILSPTLIELHRINTKQPDPATVTDWNFVDATGNFIAPALAEFVVTVDGLPAVVQAVGFKRRPLYAPLAQRDLRIDNCLYLQLATPIADNQAVQVLNPSGLLWNAGTQYTLTANPLRYSPAIHVNQEGYVPSFPKKAMVGYYAGSLGEMSIPSTTFQIVDAATGTQVYQGTLTLRADAGYAYTPAPYQKVYEADFSGFTTPGEYLLVVPGLGASLAFLIDDGVAMAFARTYALGLYHQRCGTNNAFPFTRFTHDDCHLAPAAVPLPQSSYPFTWNTVSNYALITNPDNPAQIAPKLTSPAAQLYPFVRTGTIDTSGGHHDAGDYSKYTINSASLIHDLMFAADALPGVAALDNLGLPESGDGISDVLQEAKWEADYLAKIQDSDGGFYFLVYPQNREYENNVPPDRGDPQVVWPKTTSVTAAAVAALAQCASSPLMKQKYPAAAALYLQKAQLGWQFLTNAIALHGKDGAYQKITHYGDDFAHNDELAWAACEMFLATGDPAIHQTLKSWFPDPTDPATFRWGWWRLYACYGNAVRSYAFAARSGRLAAGQLDAAYLSKCETTITNAGNDALAWSQENAYGSSFPDATKRVRGAGWYFSADQAFDITVACQLNARPEYLAALVANMNYEGGCNPVNVSYVTGLGWKRQREIVDQYSQNDRRRLPKSGIPLGNIQQGFVFVNTYGTELSALTFPPDDAGTAPYPYYDRWADTFNVSTEFVVLNQARGLGTLAFLATQTPVKTQAWTSVTAQITGLPTQVSTNTPVTASVQVPGLDLGVAA
ncbi:MAG: glycoside hydrolase family 9 protein, partial [Pedosphaera parvula]|nr:glycoside hydrolase family 9 protein [Pedosphaera parvula]